MKQVVYMCLFFFVCSQIQAKERDTTDIHRKTFQLGATIGFNTTFPIINSISVNDIELENISLQYKVGNLASLFCRVNINRFFIQPAVSWHQTESDIFFTIPQYILTDQVEISEASPQHGHLEMRKTSLQMPVHIGFDIVKEGPYGLSFMAGPTFKYNYDVSYKSKSTDAEHIFLSESTPLGVSISMGVAVQIWQLFFDFSYEFGLNHVESDFRNKNQTSAIIDNNIKIDQRINVMSFSLGIVF